MSDDTDNFYKWDDELTERESFLIGKIMAQWGALEHEIFIQTLISFENEIDEVITLPTAMNNLQFTEIAKLWDDRVVQKAEMQSRVVLEQQLDKILKLNDYRDALVHGMWHWSKTELSIIISKRIRKKEIISVHFTADELAKLYSELGSINFKIRFPRGFDELAQKCTEQGFHFSRLGLGFMLGDSIAEEWLIDNQKDGPKSR